MILVTFASKGYEKYQLDVNKNCNKFNICNCMYDEEWLRETPEFQQNQNIFSSKRGFGYWAWKPLVILDAFEFDDLVVYCDCAIMFDKNPVDTVSKVSGIGVYSSDVDPGNPPNRADYFNNKWVKRDCFYFMGCEEEKYWNGIQIWAGVVVARKSSQWFIKEWLRYALDERIVSDNPNICGLPNRPEFRDHRHDQAILSLLCLKYPETIQYLEPCFRDRP